MVQTNKQTNLKNKTKGKTKQKDILRIKFESTLILLKGLLLHYAAHC